MTYRDPNTERERNLGQDESPSVGSWIAGLVVLALLAFGGYYYYSHAPQTATLDKPAATSNSSSSTGASSGTSGSDVGSQPAQDSTGVKSEPGVTSAPADTPSVKPDEGKPQ